MWNTPDGLRVVRGAEGRLVRLGLRIAIDRIDERRGVQPLEFEFSVGVFDQLTWQQQLALLAEVSAPLFDEGAPPPPNAAIYDATVAAIYQTIFQLIEMEINMERLHSPDDGSFEEEFGVASDCDGPSTRQLVVDACRQLGHIDEIPEPDCSDADIWAGLVEDVMFEVLTDCDWEYADAILDADPDKGRQFKSIMGIGNDYYVTTPPDVDDQAADEARRRLLAFLGPDADF